MGYCVSGARHTLLLLLCGCVVFGGVDAVIRVVHEIEPGETVRIGHGRRRERLALEWQLMTRSTLEI